MTEYIFNKNLQQDFHRLSCKIVGKNKVLYVVDENVYKHYRDIFYIDNENTFLAIVKSGEMSKSFDTLYHIYDALIENNFTRSDYIFAVGGGVVGDVAGLAGATYMRGMRLVFVPTTTISMIDSSIGGKTAINYCGYKNIIGSFYQADYVITDVNFLKTLDEENFRSGIAELVKIAAIKDRDLFDSLLFERLENDSENLEAFIRRGQLLKRNVVQSDFMDKGDRECLNFGHTFAHAIESSLGLRGVSHGKAVAKGMLIVSKLAAQKGIIDIDVYQSIRSALCKQGIDTDFYIDKSSLVPYFYKDKKVKEGYVRVILVDYIGSWFVHKVSVSDIKEFVGSDDE